MTISHDSLGRFLRRAVALATGAVLSTVLVPAPPARGQAPQASSRTVASADAWPREYASSEGKVLFYQPQLDAWDGTKFEAHAAVAIERKNAATGPLYGVIWFSSNTEVDKETRRVTFLDMTIERASFPSAPESADRFKAALQTTVPPRTRTITLDRLEAALAERGLGHAPSSRDLQHAPPTIVFAEVPTLHVPIDGKPAFRPTGQSGVDRVINSRQLILVDRQENRFYLHLFDGWMTAPAIEGPWAVAEKPPKTLDKAAKAVLETTTVDLLEGISPEAAGDAKAVAPPTLAKGPVPSIFVSTAPTEIIVTEGRPNFAPLDGTQLLYVANTTANVFKSLTDQNVYVLLSGRWFRAPDMGGPWVHVAGKDLPADFKAIPDSSPKENVKASVPGTAQAEEALIANDIPQTATVRRSATRMSAIQYDGAPQFKPIEGTTLSYAANAGTPVIQVNASTYFAVDNGVWFVAGSATGPWAVADAVPDVIYTIPPSSPLYYVTFVKIYNASGDEVQVGYTPGYYGAVSEDEDDDGDADVVVYGTGYCTDPWIDSYWWGWPCGYGWGYGLAWTPWLGWCWGWGGYWGWNSIGGVGWGWATGPWGGAVAWGPRGWIGSTGNVYNRWGSTSVVSRHGAAYNRITGNYWTRDLGAAYNSRTGAIAAGHKASVTNVFTGNSVSAGKGIVYNPNTGNATRVSGIRGDQGGVVRSGDNVYAGKDGELYRKGDNGWQEFKPGSGWDEVRPDREPKNRDKVNSLDREQKVREKADKRSKDYNRSYDRSKAVDRGRVPSRSMNRGSFGGRGGGGRRGRR
jgi:hypothetical protein